MFDTLRLQEPACVSAFIVPQRVHTPQALLFPDQ